MKTGDKMHETNIVEKDFFPTELSVNPASSQKFVTVISSLYYGLLNGGCICKTVKQEEREQGGKKKQRVWSTFLESQLYQMERMVHLPQDFSY